MRQQRTIDQNQLQAAMMVAEPQSKSQPELQQQEQGLNLSPRQIWWTLGTTGTTLLASVGIDIATHWNVPMILAEIVGLYAIGRLTPATIEVLLPGSNPDAVMDVVKQVATHYAPEDPDQQQLPQDTLSKIKRLLHIETATQQLAAPSQPKDERPAGIPPTSNKRKLTAKQSEPQASDDDLIAYVPPTFMADEVLDVIKAFNAQDCIYFGDSKDGAVALPFDDMYHVFDMSASGHGKSNRMRLAMMQIAKYCQTYYINPLAAPVKKVRDKRQVEVWQPIYDLLSGDQGPVQDAEGIGLVLGNLVDEIDRRKRCEQKRDFSWEERPIFVFIDELPETFKLCPDAKEHMDTIGRMGRQFRIFMWVCSQSAQVARTGLSLDALANFHTRIYGSGDARSRENIIGAVSRAKDRTLISDKKGLTLMLADGMDASDFVRAPLLTNEAMFEYLELPPFDLEDWLLPEEEDDDEEIDPVYERNKQALRRKNREEADGVLPFTPVENTPKSRQNSQEKAIKASNYQSVKGPHYDAILDAVEALEAEEKPLTLNAIAVRAGLNRNKYEEIEMTVTYAGYDLVIGQGRPKER